VQSTRTDAGVEHEEVLAEAIRSGEHTKQAAFIPDLHVPQLLVDARFERRKMLLDEWHFERVPPVRVPMRDV
jgi:hypothetical protein